MEKKIALITGAGRGIGRAIALKLAKQGCFVVVNYNSSEAEANATLEEIIAAGGEGMTVKADVSSLPEVQKMFKTVAEQAGTVEILVCNAGVTRDNLLMRMKEEDWDKVIASNLTSLFYCAKEALRPMLKARAGRIIAISSVVGLVGNAGQCNYAASKAGINGFVKSLAREVASRGVTVNAIAPGYVATHMTSVLSSEIMDAMLKNIPAGRIGAPEDIANAVAFLASEDASYIQGQVLAVDGGMTM
jgi:3-oxoacyl-[acyl-carrier protein] reductase